MQIELIHNLHKDLYGFRPRIDFTSWSDEKLDEYIELLIADLREEEEDLAWERHIIREEEAYRARMLGVVTTPWDYYEA